MYESSDLTLGQLFELRCVGKCSTFNSSYLPFVEAFEKAKRNQGEWNPFKPSTDFGRGLLKMIDKIVKEKMKTAGLEKPYSLGFYVSVDTALDQFHGVDAFIILHNDELGHEMNITLDFSLNPGKITAKADVVLQEEDVIEIEKAGSLENLSENEPKEFPKKIEHMAEWLWEGSGFSISAPEESPTISGA